MHSPYYYNDMYSLWPAAVNSSNMYRPVLMDSKVLVSTVVSGLILSSTTIQARVAYCDGTHALRILEVTRRRIWLEVAARDCSQFHVTYIRTAMILSRCVSDYIENIHTFKFKCRVLN